MTPLAPRRYTVEEDEQIRDAIEHAFRIGAPIDPVFEQLSLELEDRTPAALSHRYYAVLKKRYESDFVPDSNNSTRRNGYSPEDDEKIWAAIELAEAEGIPLEAIQSKLAEDLDRTPVAISARITMLRRKHREETAGDDDDDDDGDVGIVSKLKSIVKERDYYKKQYESLKKETDEKLANYDKMARELRKIRKLLD